jgi:arginyl-tRNA synthetase
MPTVLQILEERVRAALTRAGFDRFNTPQVVPAAEARHGDYQTNAAMVLAQRLKSNPRSVAERIVAHLEISGLSEPPNIAGPGFINFRLSPELVCERLVAISQSDRLGVELAAEPETIVIDFSAPNIAKPMHVGHIRSTILGDALGRVARFLGHRVISDNHLGDWGTQFGKVIYGWKHLLDSAALGNDPIAELVRLYREADAQSKTDPAVLEECRRELVKLQQGDPENVEIWQRCVDLSKREFDAIYALLGISFDVQLGESFYNPQLPALVERLLKEGIAEESEGALVIRDESLSETPFMVRKSDGGFGYATTDIATLEYRVKRWQPQQIWYVVGAPQHLHFQQLFSVARKLGLKVNLQHIAFGSILGEDRKLMRTRSGESVPLKELLAEAVSRAGDLVAEKNPELPPEDRKEIAGIVGLGAVKYAELSQHRLTDYVFSWSKMLSFQGNTAPYLQNAYVRSRSIFRKLDRPFSPRDRVQLEHPMELTLAKKLLQFGEVVPAILDGFKPNILANYLYELAATFHGFYEACPVLTAEGDLRQARLLLCRTFAGVLQEGLALLGIEAPERM